MKAQWGHQIERQWGGGCRGIAQAIAHFRWHNSNKNARQKQNSYLVRQCGSCATPGPFAGVWKVIWHALSVTAHLACSDTWLLNQSQWRTQSFETSYVNMVESNNNNNESNVPWLATGACSERVKRCAKNSLLHYHSNVRHRANKLDSWFGRKGEVADPLKAFASKKKPSHFCFAF